MLGERPVRLSRGGVQTDVGPHRSLNTRLPSVTRDGRRAQGTRMGEEAVL